MVVVVEVEAQVQFFIKHLFLLLHKLILLVSDKVQIGLLDLNQRDIIFKVEEHLHLDQELLNHFQHLEEEQEVDIHSVVHL